MEHGRKNFQTGLQEENKDIWSIGRGRNGIWSRGMALEHGRLDRIQRKYVKWILDLDMTTPNYILVEECKLTEIKEKALRRATRYEGKSIESKKELVKECIKKRERN